MTTLMEQNRLLNQFHVSKNNGINESYTTLAEIATNLMPYFTKSEERKEVYAEQCGLIDSTILNGKTCSDKARASLDNALNIISNIKINTEELETSMVK